MIGRVVMAMLFLLTPALSFSQSPTEPEVADTSGGSLIIIDYADTTQSFLTEEGDEVLILTGNVQLHQDSLFMYCDSTRKQKNNLRAVGNVLLQQWDSVSAWADTLVYLGQEQEANLSGDVFLKNGKQTLYTTSLHYDVEQKVARYAQRAWLSDDTTTITSIRGTYYVDSDIIHFRDSVYVQSRDFELYADTLQYASEPQLVTFLGPTLIFLEDSAQVYCEGGFYDLAKEEGLFIENAQYVQKDQTATGDSIRYWAKSELVRIVGDAEVKKETSRASGNAIDYDLAQEKMYINGNGLVIDSSQVIRSESITYDVQNDQFATTARTFIDDKEQSIAADSIEYDTESGLARAKGDVIWNDSLSQYTIFTERANYRDSLGFLKAFQGRPLLLSIVDGDSLFLAADTLISFERYTDSDTFRIFRAFHNVKIFKHDLQARCDSLTYSTRDSIFRLFDQPVLWADTSQFSADSMKILMANNEIDQIQLDNDAFVINTPDDILYNQMKGKSILVKFVDGEAKSMDIEGNAESVYYALDDDGAYIGVNKTLCSNMLIRMGNNQVSDIVFYASPEASFYPIQQAKHDELRMEGFDWKFHQRPKTPEEIRMPLEESQ
ncbi:MAG: hypothetical protein KTR24_02095 [Saprospiraceae bacterium]|nr:hypothetical protein [Saprospiraceae bacterium]